MAERERHETSGDAVVRSTPEWIGKTDDTPIPQRVQDRVCAKSNDACVTCSRRVGGKLKPEIDHTIPLILGGKNRESNLQLLCNECHGLKTKRDVKIKAKVARVRQKDLGIRKTSSNPMPGSKASKFKKRVDGTVVLR